MKRELAAPRTAWLRTVPITYDRCVRQRDVSIDVERARYQHLGYMDLLEHLGITVELWEEDEDFPDSCFIEDTAVVLDEQVLITRLGCASRRGEGELLEGLAAEGRFELHAMAEPATLDGGDVLRVGSTLFVGRTARTDDAGIARLAEVARRDGLEVVPVVVAVGLHLKSSVTLLDPGRVLCRAGAADLGPLRARGIECVQVPEPEGANVLALGTAVVVSAAAPRTAERVADLGFDVHLAELGELHKGDGGLTCLSLRFAPPGCWCV